MNINKLDDIVNECNNRYHIRKKMKPVVVKSVNYIEYNHNSNDKHPKFQFGDHGRKSKYKNIFAKRNAPNWSEEIFVISKIKNTVSWTYVINDRNGEVIVGTCYKKELQKSNQEEFKTEKVNKGKGNKLYVKWNGYDNLFNNWIDKKTWIYKKQVDIFLNHLKLLGNTLMLKLIKIDVDKSKIVLVDLSELSSAVNNYAVKKTVYYKLVVKVDNIDFGRFLLKTQSDTEKSDLEKKISDADKKIHDTSGLAKKQIIMLKLVNRT